MYICIKRLLIKNLGHIYIEENEIVLSFICFWNKKKRFKTEILIRCKPFMIVIPWLLNKMVDQNPLRTQMSDIPELCYIKIICPTISDGS